MIPFLFAPESPRPWAILRILLAAALLWDTATRWPYAVELYSTAGFPFPAFPSAVFQPVPLDALPTVVLHSILAAALGFLLIGWHSRLCSLVAFGLMGWFALLDAAGTLTKYTAIGMHLLFLMSLAQSGGAWSVDAWWRKRTFQATPLVAAWTRWLVRLLVCSVYVGAAVTKIRLPDFATGDLLEFSLLDDAFGGRWPGFWLATKPKLLILGSFATIAFELLFPALVWVPRLRRPVLASAFLFHMGLAVFMHLDVFSPVMLAALCAFLTEDDLQAIQGRWRKLFARVFRKKERRIAAIPETKPRQLRWLNSALFLLISSGLVAGLAGYQYEQDPYGVFHRSPDVSYPPVKTELANRMIDAFQPDPRDYFHRIEVGSRLGYRHAYGERKTFHPGEVVHVMVRLLQPHPSWDVEWELIAPGESKEDQQRPAARFQSRLDASHAYTSIGFQLKPEFPAGGYLIRLSVSESFAAKQVIAEIPFEMTNDQ